MSNVQNSQSKTDQDLRIELERARGRLVELEATANAIGSGAVDAVVVKGPRGSQLFRLQGPDDPYRILVERMNEGAATLSADGIVLYCNRRLAEMMHLPPERLLGLSLSSMLREDRRSSVPDLLRLAVGCDVRTESDLLREDGTLLHVQLSLSAVALDDAFGVICAVASDLSELSRVKRGLREQAEVFELAHDAILIRGLDGRIKSWNRGATDLYGWSAEEALGKIGHDLMCTEFPISLEAVRGASMQQKEWEGELRQTCRDGGEVLVASRWSLVRDENGDPIASLEINRDITKTRIAELELHKSEEAYRTLAEFVPQLIWRADPDGQNIYFNPQWEIYTGQSVEDAHGAGWDTPFHPDEKQSVWDAWNHSVRTGETFKSTFRLRAVDGTYRWFLSKGLPLRDAQGVLIEWLGTCTDIDDQKRAEAEIQVLNRELENRVAHRTAEVTRINAQLTETIKELEAFGYSVSHDLRAPLRHLDGYLSLLCRKSYAAMDGTDRHYLDSALESSQRMGQLIDELLQFSRLGRSSIHGTSVDLNDVLEEVRRELQPEIGNRKIMWHLDRLPTVLGDRAMLRQMIENLVGNAIKFTQNRETAEIAIGIQPGSDREVVVFVQDNGAGFDMQYYNKLFQVFQRLHGEREFEGTGIGLAIVQRVVERHGGRVWAEGAVDAGATFYFSLPLKGMEGEGSDECAEANLVG